MCVCDNAIRKAARKFDDLARTGRISYELSLDQVDVYVPRGEGDGGCLWLSLSKQNGPNVGRYLV